MRQRVNPFAHSGGIMYIYIGYVLLDYATPVCLGLNKNDVKTQTTEIAGSNISWVKAVKVLKTGVFKLNND